MPNSFMRIPYTGRLPPPIILPPTANTIEGAVQALQNFLTLPAASYPALSPSSKPRTVLLTGAGISVASGLADYRGTNGTYTLNKTYRPIFYHEFAANHEARKRYWVRSFLGWANLNRAKPNDAHWAIKTLGELGLVSSVVTQNVDSFHPTVHPELKTLELHGYLRSLVCISCQNHLPRTDFQKSLVALNPTWVAFLAEMLAVGAFDTEKPDERRSKGLKTNPDGDVDLPDVQYTSFRYPACPSCLANPPVLKDGAKARVEVDDDGAWRSTSTAGILKPSVVMFGESISTDVKSAAEEAVEEAQKMLVVGSSLATYSAWRLVQRAKERKMPIGIISLGGVREEEYFFTNLEGPNGGEQGLRSSESAEKILPQVVHKLKDLGPAVNSSRIEPKLGEFFGRLE